MSIPRVLVSILNYNSFENTIKTIRCLQCQSYNNFHLQLIDNNSDDGSLSKICAIFPTLSVVRTSRNLGYTGGNNLALRKGLEEGYDYVLICNEDIEVDAYAIESMVETAQEHEKCGVVGAIEQDFFTGQIRAVGGLKINMWIGRTYWLTRLPRVDTHWLRVEYVQGAFVLFSRRALELGVRFDENLFIYLDEADIGLQLKQRDLEAYVDLRVIVRHKHRPKNLNPRAGYLIQRNRYYFLKKYGKLYHRLFYHLYTASIELPIKLILRSFQGHPYYAWACLLGHVDGVQGRMGMGRVATL